MAFDATFASQVRSSKVSTKRQSRRSTAPPLDDDRHLTQRWRAAAAWAEIVIGHASTNPTPPPEFTDAELAELTLTVAVAQGFSKAAIAWGPAPELPVMTIPTPS